jgi:hypothetical protein
LIVPVKSGSGAALKSARPEQADDDDDDDDDDEDDE